MPEQYRALAFILTIAFFSFFFLKKIIEPQNSPNQFKSWRNTWLTITLIAFLANSFWIYIVIAGILLWFIAKKEDNKLALFFAILFAVPMINVNIPAMGLINFLFSINYARLLSFAILLPAYLVLRTKPDTLSFGKNWPDKILMTYMVLSVVLLLRGTSFTNMIRGTLYSFTDIFLPYYVASRGIKDLKQLKEVMIAYLFASILVGAFAIFEFGRHWLLFSSLPGAWEINWEMGGYLNRGGNLRAVVSLGQPIVLGYVMMLALGLYLFLANFTKSKILYIFGLILILAGLYVPLSRGPWVGAIALITIFIATGPSAIKRLTISVVTLLFFLPILGKIPGGQKIMSLIPFVGNANTGTVDYRVNLLDNSLIVFKNNPMLGSVNYRDDLANMGMIQGEGIVDIVNSYLEIVLRNGLVGLTLFLVFFSLIILAIHKSMRKINDKKSQKYLFGRTLISCIIGILVTIFTVSSIQLIPIIYWAFAGLGITNVRLASMEVGNSPANSTEKPVLPTFRLAIKT